MQKSVWTIIMVCLLVACNGSRQASDFNEGWLFWTDSLSQVKESVRLPHTPRLEPLVVNDQWQGICYYEKTFTLERGTLREGKSVWVRFDGAMNVAQLWVNGQYMGKHLGGYLPFVCDITSALNPKNGARQILRVQLDNTDNPITGPKPLKQLDFNMYGGLYREAHLIVKHPLHFTDPILENAPARGGVLVTTPQVGKESVVKVQSHIRYSPLPEADAEAAFALEQRLWLGDSLCATAQLEKSALKAGEDTLLSQLLIVPQAQLWSPANPVCYRLQTLLLQDGIVVDSLATTVGLRTIELIDKDLYINGEKIFLRGVNRHQEYPYVGYALPKNAHWRDAAKIKAAGFDAVRLSHYPTSPHFMDACDHLGLLVFDAVPGWQYFSQDPAFQDQVIQTARDMIRRDRNHPCVLAWEVSLNESWMSNAFIDRMIEAARQEMPVPIFTVGWQEYGYDIYFEARQHRYGKPFVQTPKPYNVSEYGDWEYYAKNAGLEQHKWADLKQEERTSRQLREWGAKRMLQQALNIQEAHNSNYTVNAFGDNYWVMFDYNRGYADDLEASGIMSIDRIPKFSYYFFRSQRSPYQLQGAVKDYGGPMVFIADYWDCIMSGDDVEELSKSVRVFSNCQEVELWVDDRLVERRKPDTDVFSNHLPHPPFTFHFNEFPGGRLTAKAYLDGQEVATYQRSNYIALSGVSVQLDDSLIPLEKNDLTFVYAVARDTQGNSVYDASGRLSFTVNSPGVTLIGEDAQGQPMEGTQVQAPLKAGMASVLLRTDEDWNGEKPIINVTLCD